MTVEQRKINVLDDRGYIILHDVMGSDLTVVNAARVSFDKKSDVLTEGDRRLIAFLAREGHSSPSRHAMMQFEVYSPLMTARQHFKYIVGSSIQEATGDPMMAWNESSRRYVTEEPEFYIPLALEWRSASANAKQGSGEPVSLDIGSEATARMIANVDKGLEDYEWALKNGICGEQARLLLNGTYGLYLRYYWTTSLAAVAHFLEQRLADDSQFEIKELAKAVLELAREHFPVSIAALVTEVPE